MLLNDTARIILADIETDNGVIHIIDSVLLPPDLGSGSAADAPAVTPMPTATFVPEATEEP